MSSLSQAAVAFSESYEGHRFPDLSPARRAGSASSFGAYSTERILGETDVLEQRFNNVQDANRLIENYGDQLTDNDKGFLEKYIKNPALSGLTGVASVLEYFERPFSMLGLMGQEYLPSIVTSNLIPVFGMWLKMRDPSYQGFGDFFLTGEQLAMRSGNAPKEGITAEAYWQVMTGKRQDLVENIGTDLAGHEGFVGGSNILEAAGITVEGLDTLPQGIRQLARAGRFAGAMTWELGIDPFTYVTGGTAGLGRKAAQEAATAAAMTAAKASRKLLIDAGEEGLSKAVRGSVSKLEAKMADAAMQRIRRVPQWADGTTWTNKVDRGFDFQRSLPTGADKKARRALSIEDDFFFDSVDAQGNKSIVAEVVDELVHEIEIRNYGRGLGDESWFPAYREYARAGGAPHWTTGGVHIGILPRNRKPGRGVGFTIPGSEGIFRVATKPLVKTLRLGKVYEKGKLRQFGDWWRKGISPKLGRERALRDVARKKGHYYAQHLVEKEFPAISTRQLNWFDDAAEVTAGWNTTIADINTNVPKAHREEAYDIAIGAINARRSLTDVPEWFPEGLAGRVNDFNDHYSGTMDRIGRIAAEFDPLFEAMGAERGYRPFVMTDEYTKVMRDLMGQYGDELFPDVDMATEAGLLTMAERLSTAAAKAGRKPDIEVSDLSYWLQVARTSENRPKQIRSVGISEQMRYRQTGRSTIMQIGDIEDMKRANVGFVTIDRLNDALTRTTQAIIDLHGFPLKFDPSMTLTGKGTVKGVQALELDPRRQFARWVADMADTVLEHTQVGQLVRSHDIEKARWLTNEEQLKVLVEEKRLDKSLRGLIAADDASPLGSLSAQYEAAQKGRQLVDKPVAGVTMRIPRDFADSPEWTRFTAEMDALHTDLMHIKAEFPHAYSAEVDRLVAQGMAPSQASQAAYESMTSVPSESREAYAVAVRDWLARSFEEDVANLSGFEDIAAARARAQRIREAQVAQLTRRYETIEKGWQDSIGAEIQVEGFDLFASEEGTALTRRAAEKVRTQMVDVQKRRAKAARAESVKVDGPHEVYARHQAQMADLLAAIDTQPDPHQLPFEVASVRFSEGLGPAEQQVPMSRLIAESDSVVAFFHPSWLQEGDAVLETSKAVRKLVSGKSTGLPAKFGGWWESNFIELSEGLWVPRRPTPKRLVVVMHLDPERGGTALRNYLGDAGNVGVIGPHEIMRPAEVWAAPASVDMKRRFGVDGIRLVEMAKRMGVSEAELRAANPHKVHWWSERYASTRSLIEETLEIGGGQPAGSGRRRPKLSDFDNPDDFVEDLRVWRIEQKASQTMRSDTASDWQRVLDPMWDLDPNVLSTFHELMKTLDEAATLGDISQIDDWMALMRALEDFGVTYNFHIDDVEIMVRHWFEANWADLSPQMQSLYQQIHPHGIDEGRWAWAVSRFKEVNGGIPYTDFERTIAHRRQQVLSQRGVFDQAGYEMPVVRKRTGTSSETNTLQSKSGSTDFEWVEAGVPLNRPARRYAPGENVRSRRDIRRPEYQDQPAGSVSTRAFQEGEIEQAGTAVPRLGAEDAYLPERQQLAKEETWESYLDSLDPVEKQAYRKPVHRRPSRDDFPSDVEYLEAKNAHAINEARYRGTIYAITPEDFAEMPAIVDGLLFDEMPTAERIVNLASRQAGDRFRLTVEAYIPLLEDSKFIELMADQNIPYRTVRDILDRFAVEGAFYTMDDSITFRRFLAAAMHYGDKDPDGFMQAVSKMRSLEGKTVKELRQIARDEGVKGYSKLRKAQLIDHLNEYLGDPHGAAPQKVELGTTTGLGKTGGPTSVNVGRPGSGGVVGRRSGEDFGNPFRAKGASTRKVVAQYEARLKAMTDPDLGAKTWRYREDVADLAGRELLCPKGTPHSPCHAEVLARYADELASAPYEVSSAGDSRFSAFFARLPNGRTIEEAYQIDFKGYQTVRLGKGKPPVDPDITVEVSQAAYRALWDEWADNNEALLLELYKATIGRNRTLSDQFVRKGGIVDQASTLTDILLQRYGRDMPIEDVIARHTELTAGPSQVAEAALEAATPVPPVRPPLADTAASPVSGATPGVAGRTRPSVTPENITELAPEPQAAVAPTEPRVIDGLVQATERPFHEQPEVFAQLGYEVVEEEGEFTMQKMGIVTEDSFLEDMARLGVSFEDGVGRAEAGEIVEDLAQSAGKPGLPTDDEIVAALEVFLGRAKAPERKTVLQGVLTKFRQSAFAADFTPDETTMLGDVGKELQRSRRLPVEGVPEELWPDGLGEYPEGFKRMLLERQKSMAAETGRAPSLDDVARTMASEAEDNRVLARVLQQQIELRGKERRVYEIANTEIRSIQPSTPATRMTPTDAALIAEREMAALKKRNQARIADGQDALELPTMTELRRRVMLRHNAGDFARRLAEDERARKAAGTVRTPNVEQVKAAEAAGEAVDSFAVGSEVTPPAVPPYPLSTPAGPINATTMVRSGLQDGADMIAGVIARELDIPSRHHVAAMDYAKFAANWTVEDPIMDSQSAATMADNWGRQAMFRTMANVDDSDVTLAFMPRTKPGEISIGTHKTIEYAMTGMQGEDWWPKYWRGDTVGNGNPAEQPRQLLDDMVRVHPDSSIWVPKQQGAKQVIVINGPVGDAGMRILREMLVGVVNVAGPKTTKVLDAGGYARQVKDVLRAALPGRLEEGADVAARTGARVQPPPLHGLGNEMMAARLDSVDQMLGVHSAVAQDKALSMSGFVERFDVLSGADRLPRMQQLIDDVNANYGDTRKLAAFETWYDENAAAVQTLIETTYGPDAVLRIRRLERGLMATVDRPTSELVAVEGSGRSFNELVGDVIDGTLTEQEALTRGMDQVVLGAQLKNEIMAATATGPEDLLEIADSTLPARQPQVVDDFDTLTRLVFDALKVRKSKKLRAFVGGTDPDGRLRPTPEWTRIVDALGADPVRQEQLFRWVESGWLADTLWDRPEDFERWWLAERTFLLAMRSVDERRAQMHRLVDDAYRNFGEWTGQEAADRSNEIVRWLFSELYQMPSKVRGTADIPIRESYGLSPQPTAFLREPQPKSKGPFAISAARQELEANTEHSLRATKDVLRSWLTSPELNEVAHLLTPPDPNFKGSIQEYLLKQIEDIDSVLDSDLIRERAIRHGFQSAEALGLESGVLANMDLRPEVAQMFDKTTRNMGAMFTPYGLSEVLRTSNWFINLWKRWATVVRPAFHIRNFIGGVANGFFGGVYFHDYVKWGPQVMKFRRGLKELNRGFVNDPARARGGFDNIALKYVDEPYRQAFRDAWSEGVIQTGFSRTEGFYLGGRQAQSWKPWDPQWFAAVQGGRAMESIEDVLRMTMYGKYHAQGRRSLGKTMVDALHFNYSDLTSVEQAIKKVVPFWVWTRRNIPLQLRILFQSPGFMLAYDKLRRTWNEDQLLANDDNWHEDLDTSGWILPFGRSDADGWAQLMWKPDLPFMDLDNLPIFSEDESTFPFRIPGLSGVFNSAVDQLGPQYSIPLRLLEISGHKNAPRGLKPIAEALDGITNHVPGLQDMFLRSHDQAGNATSVQIPSWMDSVYHAAIPFGQDYLSGLGLAPGNPYRAADEGWLNSDNPSVWSPQGVVAGAMRNLGRGAGFRWDTPKTHFFDEIETGKRITEIQLRIRQGLG